MENILLITKEPFLLIKLLLWLAAKLLIFIICINWLVVLGRSNCHLLTFCKYT